MKVMQYLLFVFLGVLIIGISSCTDPAGTLDDPNQPSKLSPGTVWMNPEKITVNSGKTIAIKVFVNTGSEYLAAYGLSITYNKDVLNVNTTLGTNGVQAGPDGFLAAANAQVPGELVIAGFDTAGKVALSLHLITVNFTAINAGTSDMGITISNFNNSASIQIGTPAGRNGRITVM